MDMLRSCYRSSMALYRDRPDILTPGRWRWCHEDAEAVPHPHAFGSLRWGDQGVEEYHDLGEQPGEKPYDKGRPDPRKLGKHFCGSAFAWANGDLFADRGTLPADAVGLPHCCEAKAPLEIADEDAGTADQSLGTRPVGGCGPGTPALSDTIVAFMDYADGGAGLHLPRVWILERVGPDFQLWVQQQGFGLQTLTAFVACVYPTFAGHLFKISNTGGPPAWQEQQEISPEFHEPWDNTVILPPLGIPFSPDRPVRVRLIEG